MLPMNLIHFNVNLFRLNHTLITFRTLCLSLMLIVSSAYSRLNNFPRHFARKGMRELATGSELRIMCKDLVLEGVRATLFRQRKHQRIRHYFLSFFLSFLSLSPYREFI